ncbi:hypothetical protein K440DRAFT_636498 [Wilcoxina mikolae CBS 423.85]|nr:hypothetical protein K440DRAFT_636498 [Wilcoxina mikolae CBS 423.85]
MQLMYFGIAIAVIFAVMWACGVQPGWWKSFITWYTLLAAVYTPLSKYVPFPSLLIPYTQNLYSEPARRKEMLDPSQKEEVRRLEQEGVQKSQREVGRGDRGMEKKVRRYHGRMEEAMKQLKEEQQFRYVAEQAIEHFNGGE